MKLNSEKIAIITDSCADIPASLREKHNIYVIPLKVFCDDNEYLDGIEINYENIYDKMKNADRLGTSLPDGKIIEQTFFSIAEKGYTNAVVITISSGLSGTFNMIKLNADLNKNLSVKVLDSKNCSLGQAMIVLQLAEYLEKGMDWNTLIKQADKLIKNTHSYIYADTLEYLHKGGRIGKIKAFAGTMLNIKPILSLDEKGVLYSLAKTRGKKQGREKLISLLKSNISPGKKYNISAVHGNSSHEMIVLCKELKDALPNYKNFWYGHTGAAVSVHLGPGILAAAVQLLEQAFIKILS